jgi:hypothetical protein
MLGLRSENRVFSVPCDVEVPHVVTSTDFADPNRRCSQNQKHTTKQPYLPAHTMLFRQIARVTVQPVAQRQQRRTILNWMTNYPDRVSNDLYIFHYLVSLHIFDAK